MKRILIIGATSAIAVACARRWAGQGARFVLVARDAVRLEQTGADLRIRGADVQTFVLDALDFGRQGHMLEAAVAVLGQIDLALVAVGTLPDQKTCERDAVLAAREFAINGGAAIALLTNLAVVFETQRYGCLAVITSVAGDRGRPSNYLYGSAKAAVSTFCEGLRARLHDSGVQVIDVRPGFVATPMTQRLTLPPLLVAQPDTVARSIVACTERGKPDVLYVPAFWRLIMLGIRSIPGFAFKRMRL